MTSESLKFISDSMDAMGLNYAFMEYTDEPVYPYFTGEYSESPPMYESGMQETTFILNGFSRTTWESLETAKALIESYFDRTVGRTAITASGHGVAIFYSNSMPIPTGDAELKRLQINLTIKEWKVN